MDILGWIGWLLWKIVGLAWSLIWFLLGGWVSTLAQIAVIALIIFGYKYGWRQAPQQILTRSAAFGRFVWAWVRARELPAGTARTEVREVYRDVRVKEIGDVNVSTLLSLLVLAGLSALPLL
ncbi:MAG: hypothetical protein ACKVP7_01395 [Hyphomicrobiaceae bacterium]